jgi:hypothetical protein
MKKVLDKVRKNKPRVQKAPKQPKPSASIFTTGGRGSKPDRDDQASSASWKDKMPKQIKQLFGQKKNEPSGDAGMIVNHDTREPLLVKSY